MLKKSYYWEGRKKLKDHWTRCIELKREYMRNKLKHPSIWVILCEDTVLEAQNFINENSLFFTVFVIFLYVFTTEIHPECGQATSVMVCSWR